MQWLAFKQPVELQEGWPPACLPDILVAKLCKKPPSEQHPWNLKNLIAKKKNKYFGAYIYNFCMRHELCVIYYRRLRTLEMAKSESEEVRLNLEQQFGEFELLQSMYSAPGEFTVDTPDTLALIRAFTDNTSGSLPKADLCFSIYDKVPVILEEFSSSEDEENDTRAEICKSIQICCQIPQSYPLVSNPIVHVRNNELSRKDEESLNKRLEDYIGADHVLGEPCLLNVIQWVKDNCGSFFSLDSDFPVSSNPAVPEFCRMWLYMHHIYSKTKRRSILAWAEELELTGFCLPGKPGVVCVEGMSENTSEYYHRLRKMNWKSITCRKCEIVECAAVKDVKCHHKIQGFGELAFDTRGPRGNHMSMGQFYQYLELQQLGYMFKELFGVEGKAS